MTNTYPYIPPENHKFFTVELPDVSGADQRYVVPGFAGRLVKVWTALNGAIGSADCTVTPKIGGTAVTGGTVTIAYTDSAAGDVDSAVPTALNNFASGQAIEIENDAAASNSVAVVVTLECEPC